MKPNPIVLCDANVLYGQWLRDLVMWLGISGLMRPRWTERIEAEWLENLLRKRPDLPAERLRRIPELMNRALPQARVTPTEPVATFALPDPDDVHVLQAAVGSGAAYLLTFNLSDFPPEVCRVAGVEVVHPDAFLLELLREHPEAMRQALLEMQGQKTRPPVSWGEMAQALGRAGLPAFSGVLLEADVQQ